MAEAGDERALFTRYPQLRGRIPWVPLADGLPTPVERVERDLWVQRDDGTSSVYGGNKVRKLEHVLAVAVERGGPLLTAGGTGSHHVVATATHGARLGLVTEAVVFPQPDTDDAVATAEVLDGLAARGVLRRHPVRGPYLMPLGLGAALGRARVSGSRGGPTPTLVLPGASSPLGVVGHVGAGLELVEHFSEAGWAEPDCVVVALGSGGSAAGLALGIALGGWSRCRVHAVRATDAVAANVVVVRGLVALTAALLARHGAPRPELRTAARVARARLDVDGGFYEGTYGAPSPVAAGAAEAAARWGLAVEPTYTERATAAALALHTAGQRVVLHHTFAGHP